MTKTKKSTVHHVVEAKRWELSREKERITYPPNMPAQFKWNGASEKTTPPPTSTTEAAARFREPPQNCLCPPLSGLFYEYHQHDKYHHRQALRKLRRASS
jgi:hypothetical protein